MLCYLNTEKKTIIDNLRVLNSENMCLKSELSALDAKIVDLHAQLERELQEQIEEIALKLCMKFARLPSQKPKNHSEENVTQQLSVIFCKMYFG